MALQKGEGRTEIIHHGWSVPGRVDEIAAWLARPDRRGRGPGLVVAHDIFGLTPHVQEVSKRFARMGYAALAPDLFARVGAPLAGSEAEARGVSDLVTDGQALADLEDAVEFLCTLDEVDPTRMGVVGFCVGGRLGLLLAARMRRRLKACVSFYGALGKVARLSGGFRSRVALDLVGEVTAPALALVGEQDQWVPKPDVDALRAGLVGGGRVVVYRGAGHRFFNEARRDVFDPVAASDAWDRTIAFLDETLGWEVR